MKRLPLVFLTLAVALTGCTAAVAPPAADEPLAKTGLPLPSPTTVDPLIVPSALPENLPSPTAPPALTPGGEATPSPSPAATLKQLTTGGCCVQPFWSPDGQRVLYIDRPASDAPTGLWGIDLSGSKPQFISDRLGIYSLDMSKRAYPEKGNAIVEDLATGERWTIVNGGRAVSFSPDGLWLAWTAGQDGPPFDSALREVWISRFDGSQTRQVFSATGGGFAGWFPDGRLLVSGRLPAPESGQVYWALTLGSSEQPDLLELGRGGRLRSPSLSTDGSWLAYLSTFSEDSSLDGLWVVNTTSGERRRLEVFGAYQWRDANRLFVIPLDLSQPTHRLLQVQAANGQTESLTDPASTPFKIAAGDWAVSPDGTKIIFVSAQDSNIWLLSGGW